MTAKDKAFYLKKTLNLSGNLLDLSTPKIMGIINVTPDSFYDGSRYMEKKHILKQAEKHIIEGADIIDIGGYSSRPGAANIDSKEEESRVLKGLTIIRNEFPEVPVSIDTFRTEVAIKALDLGAAMINDISGGNMDEKMYETIAHYKVPYVLMHMKGNPQNMASQIQYSDLINEIITFFHKKLHYLTQFGVNDVVIDIGFGFSKTLTQNYELLKKLKYFQLLNVPVLVGISRKSMIYKTLETDPDHALNGTTVLNTLSIINGASILRVHDVKEAKETIILSNLTLV